MILRSVALALLLLSSARFAAAQSTVEIAADTPKGTVYLTAALHRPSTAEPRPAVLIMHGCGGVAGSHARWADVFNGWGYVALVLDSFGGRGAREVCTGKEAVEARDRAWDAAAAVSWLRHQSFVLPDRVALQGHSHGGASVLFAALRETGDRRPPPSPQFRAVTSFYPDCTLRGRTTKSFEALVPVQILIGEKDDWTLPENCRALLPRLSGKPVDLTVYPDAYHGFDSVGSKPRYREEVRNRNKPGGCCGAWVGYNEPAYRASVQKIRDFLQAELGGGR
jgi:dienelactone hydrolase